MLLGYGVHHRHWQTWMLLNRLELFVGQLQHVSLLYLVEFRWAASMPITPRTSHTKWMSSKGGWNRFLPLEQSPNPGTTPTLKPLFALQQVFRFA